MSNLLKRLQRYSYGMGDPLSLITEAADEIDRLNQVELNYLAIIMEKESKISDLEDKLEGNTK